MVEFMKCIKTGCDVICDGRIYHGDLFYHDKVFILSGVSKEYLESVNSNVDYLRNKHLRIFYHLQCKEMFEIPSGNSGCYMIKKVFDLQDHFCDQILKYESVTCYNNLIVC